MNTPEEKVVNQPARRPRYKSRRREKVRSTILIALAVLIIWSPLPAGSVEAWALLVVELITVVMAGAYILIDPKPRLDPDLSRHLRKIRFFVWGFFGVLLLQVIPLPAGLLRLISPAAYALHANFDPQFATSEFVTLSIVPGRTAAMALEFAAYFIIGFVVIKTVNRSSQVRALVTVMVACGSFQALYGLYELTTRNPRILFYRKVFSPNALTGTFVNRGHLSGYLEMIVPLALGLIIARMSLFSTGAKGLRERILLWTSKGIFPILIIVAGAALMCLGIVLSNSRSGLVVLVFSLFLFFGLSVMVSKQARYGHAWLKNLIKVSFLLLLVLALYQGVDTTIDRFALDDLLSENRPVYWSNVVGIVKDFPLFGTGFGVFADVYPAYEKIGSSEMALVHAHNEYLEFLSELGVIGSFFLFGLIFYLVYLIYATWRIRRNPEIKGLVLGGLVSLAGTGLHAFTDFNLHIPANIVLFTIVLTLTVSASFHNRIRVKQK